MTEHPLDAVCPAAVAAVLALERGLPGCAARPLVAGCVIIRLRLLHNLLCVAAEVPEAARLGASSIGFGMTWKS